MVTLLIIVVALMGILFFFLKNDSSKKKKKLEESLNDELILDPFTGRKVTLEQAEHGYAVDIEEAAVRSDEEIQENYEGEEREYNLVINDFLKRGYKPTEPEKIEELISSGEMMESYEDFQILDVFTIESWGIVGVLKVVYDYRNGKYNETVFEN